ncbi:MAG: isoamylase early set domain-containing protein [Ilumatobacteraceae bacterium]
MIERIERRDGVIELKFLLPIDHPARPVGVAGDFNGWDWSQTLLEQHGDLLEASVRVEHGRSYQFRYRGGDQTWFNDDRADDYVPNEFGGVNCLVDLSSQ